MDDCTRRLLKDAAEALNRLGYVAGCPEQCLNDGGCTCGLSEAVTLAKIVEEEIRAKIGG